MPPAQAMQPEAPPAYKPTLIERLGLQQLFSQPARMILRRLERRPVRAALSALGIALAAAVLVVSNFSVDAINVLIDTQFRVAQRQDLTLAFVEPRSRRALHEVRQLPGVVHAEPFRNVPVRLEHRHHQRDLAIQGLPGDASLRVLLDDQGRTQTLPADGIVLSDMLAEILDVGVGDAITVHVLEGRRPTRQTTVTGIIEELLGLSAYMEIEALNRFLREGPLLSGALIQADADHRLALFERIKQTPGVATVDVKEAAIANFRDTMAENLAAIRSFTVGFAAIIAIGVVYNTARVSLSERSRELATMRVLGFTRREIAFVLLGEVE